MVDALIRHARQLPGELYQTLAWDRGKELADHRRFTSATDIQVYFCDPQHPWQPGANENTNGLLRQYFPKSTGLSAFSQAKLDEVARRLNERPRKTLNCETPIERYQQAVALTGWATPSIRLHRVIYDLPQEGDVAGATRTDALNLRAVAMSEQPALAAQPPRQPILARGRIASDNRTSVHHHDAEDRMTTLTINPLGIAALESMDLAFNQKKIDEAMSYLSEPYIQHNPKVPSGIAMARKGMEMLAKAFPERRVEFKRVLVDGDLVAVHSHYIDKPGDLGQAVVDIFRFENGKIVEHWDVHEDVPETAANDNTMF